MSSKLATLKIFVVQSTIMPNDKYISWLKLVAGIRKKREQRGLTPLFEPEGVLINLKLKGKNPKSSAKLVYNAYLALCKSIIKSSKINNRNVTSDSFISISELIFALDFGFEIICEYLNAYLTTTQVREKLYDSQIIYEAYTILDNKKIAAMRGGDPFDTILSQIENFEKWIDQAYEVVETLGISNTISYNDFEEKTNFLKESASSGESKNIVMEALYKVLEERNMCFSINFNESDRVFFDKIAQTFPSFKIKNYRENYIHNKSIKEITFKLDTRNVNIKFQLGALHKDLISFINPLIEKQTGRCLLSMPTISRQVFIVAPSSKRNKLLSNKFLFRSS